MTWPEIPAPTLKLNISVISSRPECEALSPRKSWRNIGTKTFSTMAAPDAIELASAAKMTTGLDSTPSGTSGSGARRSRTTKPAQLAADSATEADHGRRYPVEAAAAEIDGDHQRRRRHHDQAGAEKIETVPPSVPRQPPELRVRQREGEQAERQVDPENHRPVEILGKETAERRADSARAREHDDEIRVVLGPVLRRRDVGEDGHREEDQTAAAEALHRASEDQHEEARRQRADDRTRQEDGNGREHGRAPAIDVAQLADHRRRRRPGEEIGGRHPRDVLQIAEGAADGRQRGADDRLVERAEEHGQEHPDRDL